MRIFLGGTCANTTWRDEFIKEIEPVGIEYFNPIVEDWTPECQAIEEDEKNNKYDFRTLEKLGNAYVEKHYG